MRGLGMKRDERIVFTKTAAGDPGRVSDFLAVHTGLTKTRIKDAMAKGAVWMKKAGGRRSRVRRSSAVVRPGDRLELFYDAHLLSVVPPEPTLIADRTAYSVWLKPSGLLTQGTNYGDHCSLLRQVEIAFQNSRKVFPVHRIDREAAGLVLIAHTKKAAADLSALFRENSVRKRYRVQVLGNLSLRGTRGSIDLPLDGKSASTSYVFDSYDEATNTSTLTVEIGSGRLHQIRRHYHQIGHPVMGDPRYGTGNKNAEGLKLVACELEFDCPVQGEVVRFSLDGCLSAL